MPQLRVEIFIPLRYNEDENGIRKKIEREKIAKTLDELLSQFGGYTVNREVVDGEWLNSNNEKIIDESRSVWLVCEDNRENIDFLTHFKETLVKRFQQDEIFMLYSRVDRL